MRKTASIAEQHQKCSGWSEIRQCLEGFPAPQTTIGYQGEVTSPAWVFRGVRRSRYKLEPAIERAGQSKSMSWAALEVLVMNEFKSRAPMHMGVSSIPRDDLTWLAQMQHYAIPTRLLDFTLSPFVALYFAIRRDSTEHRASPYLRLWAIDAAAVNARFSTIASSAAWAAQKRKGRRPQLASLHPDDFATDRDIMNSETKGLRATIQASLFAQGTPRAALNRTGCVCAVSPPEFNPRLASQQGLFLLNCAEELTFSESLRRMMGARTDWVQTFDIDSSASEEIEEQLFQMNIHEQSLFPDMEGLAGLIRQKARLHWR